MAMLRDHYFPNTEPLAANEMRIIALGTGRPFVRRAQANCSWLIELGNGDKSLRSKSRTRILRRILPPICTPTTLATSLRCGLGAGAADGSNR